MFVCRETKATAIVKEALSPYSMLRLMSNPSSVLINELNDKQDKSGIILVKVFDAELGNVKTRFLDMPVVNIKTAQNRFSALKESLSKYYLDFSKTIAFMSDTTKCHERG